MKILLILLLSFLLIIGFTQTQSDDRGYHTQVGDITPDLRLTLTTGDTLQLNSLHGKVVMLQFTASWCSVCRKEMPHLESEIWQPNKDKDFILIGVDYDEPLDKVKDFVKQMKITYPMALDPGGEHFNEFAYPKSGVTRNVVIDKEGKIVFLTRLYDPSEFDEMKSVISGLLK
ncbi:MAG: TlpA disulfide reductase family protein [Bacteroidales bacterium]|nr:TlpA disulfide reductase family protein [Bacteroidales bacterium]